MSFTWTSYDQRGGGGGGMPPLPSLPPWAAENAAPSSAAAAPAFSSPSTEVNGPGWRRPTSYFGAMKRLPGSRPLERVAVDDSRDDNDGGGGQRDEHSDTPPASMTNQADEGSDAALDERKEVAALTMPCHGAFFRPWRREQQQSRGNNDDDASVNKWKVRALLNPFAKRTKASSAAATVPAPPSPLKTRQERVDDTGTDNEKDPDPAEPSPRDAPHSAPCPVPPVRRNLQAPGSSDAFPDPRRPSPRAVFPAPTSLLRPSELPIHEDPQFPPASRITLEPILSNPLRYESERDIVNDAVTRDTSSFRKSTTQLAPLNGLPMSRPNNNNDAEEKQRVKDELEQHGDDTGYKFRRLIQRYRDALPAFQRAGNPSVGSSSSTQTAPSVLPVNLSATPRLSVFVRKRPLAKKELQAKGYDVLTCLFTGSSTSAKSFLRRSLVCHEPKLKVDCSETLEHHEFRFDGVFDEFQDNTTVYAATVGPLVPTLVPSSSSSSDMTTANLTVFAYGQTGSGKTYTMKSIYRQAASDLFERLQSTTSASSCVVGVSFYEIYMNHVNDLLQGRTRIQLLEDGDGVVQLLGLKEVMISNADELMTVIATGEEARATSANAVHDDSSRSHALLRVTLYGPAPKSTGNPIVAARLCLVDLAGSERACDTQSDGKHTRMEGAEINKSLLALKECIRALDRGAAHVPFRQSKLTQLLRDTFLGSNARTVMIATVSPWSESCNHTLNTLRYADRLKEIGGEQRRGAT
ncbi:hypothetical protein ATCC90586_003422 [Pythium insidiosum]|nr:hypothetical protein ATCC90586_003422 [Pythium insidiosum]